MAVVEEVVVALWLKAVAGASAIEAAAAMAVEAVEALELAAAILVWAVQVETAKDVLALATVAKQRLR